MNTLADSTASLKKDDCLEKMCVASKLIVSMSCNLCIRLPGKSAGSDGNQCLESHLLVCPEITSVMTCRREEKLI